MDKKAKKRIAILRERIQKIHKQLAGARAQDDEPGAIERLNNEIAEIEAQIEKLKAS